MSTKYVHRSTVAGVPLKFILVELSNGNWTHIVQFSSSTHEYLRAVGSLELAKTEVRNIVTVCKRRAPNTRMWFPFAENKIVSNRLESEQLYRSIHLL